MPPGQLVGILGPHGPATSTLIKAEMGMVPLSRGLLQVFGKTVDKHRYKV